MAGHQREAALRRSRLIARKNCSAWLASDGERPPPKISQIGESSLHRYISKSSQPTRISRPVVVLLLVIGNLFFQAEDGIRDHCVTGVQTCALPIFPAAEVHRHEADARLAQPPGQQQLLAQPLAELLAQLRVLLRDVERLLRPARHQVKRLGRSEERRVGKEIRHRMSQYM